METGQIEKIILQPLRDREEEVRPDLQYASRLFPMNAFVTIMGREGVYRVVSEPYIPPGYRYPHFDVESSGRKVRVSVFTATRIHVF